MSEEENIKVYQPWSAPLLHISLNPRPLRQLIRITDTISRDPNRISYNDKLAGEIENEWQIPTSTFNFHSFKSYIKSLSWKYFETLTSQYHIENDEIPEYYNLKSILQK